VEKEHSKNNKDFTSNDSGNCTERRSYLGVSDKHEHKCARRSNLDDAHTYTRRPERRLHVKEAREHMHARRSDLGDTRKHEPERRSDLRDAHAYGSGRRSDLTDAHTHDPGRRSDQRDARKHVPS
jgi:hypothetical protein